jgi:hypothetical protein
MIAPGDLASRRSWAALRGARNLAASAEGLGCVLFCYWDPETEEAATTLELALPLLDEAAGGHVEGAIGDSDPFAAVEHEVERGRFDEIIISTLAARVSHWLRRDLPRRVEALGLPVTVVTAKQSERALSDADPAGAPGDRRR